MTTEEYDRLVHRIQAEYGSRPFALRWRIAFLVVLGYAGFLTLLLLVLVLAILLTVGAFVTDQEPGILVLALVAILLAFGLGQALVFFGVPLSKRVIDISR